MNTTQYRDIHYRTAVILGKLAVYLIKKTKHRIQILGYEIDKSEFYRYKKKKQPNYAISLSGVSGTPLEHLEVILAIIREVYKKK